MFAWDWALRLGLFAVVATFTPGPNALLLLSVAARFGLRPAVPAAVGVAVGIPSVIVVVGAGLGGAFAALPWLQVALHVLATVYIGWLGWQILRMGSPGDPAQQAARPVSAWQAAALQWVNPKVWTMAVGAVGAYGVDGGPVVGALSVGAVFAVVCVPAVGAWTLFGSGIRHWLTSPGRLLVFKVGMGAALAVSIALTWVA
ncbi:LysE family translocator [Actinokineospora fastidiosa]|uniref:Lysine transporter LysE n=1 Tax=Actinokineospora fastidiosa TaxID=1816 RepID=A0A918LAB2_9PSEU|nr:LysE family transporter [Actinokineospora fastidiosa]GGS24762.1 lysine transporter LysE [Actinokineospora fastidiosa]